MIRAFIVLFLAFAGSWYAYTDMFTRPAVATIGSGCEGTVYIFFDELTAYCVRPDGNPGVRTICNAALFSNCEYRKCCR